MRFLRREGLSRRLGARLDRHEQRAEPLLSRLRSEAGPGRLNVQMMLDGHSLPWLDQGDVDALAGMQDVDEADDDVRISLAIICATRARTGYTLESGVARRLLRRRLPWSSEDVELLFRHALSSELDWFLVERLGWAAKAAEDFVEQGGDPQVLRPELEDAAKRVEEAAQGSAGERKNVRKRLRALLTTAAPAPNALDLNLVGNDPWGKRVRALVAEHWPDDRRIGALLLHLGTATTGPRPTRAWERERDALLEAAPDGERLVRVLLESALAAPDTTREIRYGGERYVTGSWLSDASQVLVRGAVWAASPFAWAAEIVARLAEHAAAPVVKGGDTRSLLVANACARTLAALEPPAVEPLARLVHSIKHRGVRKQIERALDEAAERAGISRSRLLETAVEQHGLDESGRRVSSLGEYTAVLAAVAPGRAQLVFENAQGKELRTTPSAIRDRHAGELRRLRAERTRVEKTLKAERRRVESLLAVDSAWPFGDWRRHYLDHGVTQAVASPLVWRIDGTPLVWRRGSFVDPAGRRHDARGDGEVRLWHPLDASRDEIVTWRRFLIEEQIVQPFKQAYRETYVVAPAEEETQVYSNRFAGHVLRYPQVYALQKERGWSGNALGPWDGGFDAALRLDLPDAGVSAEFWIEAVEEDDMGPLAEHCTTDQVRFYRAGAEAEGPVPLVDVPARAFSEAMRDVDLFVSVASIGADPNWQDRGEHRYAEYWERAVFPEDLSESARVRRDVLADLLPRLAIAGRCELGDTYLRVRGDRGAYRIHLGSAAVTAEPEGRFLCIVPARRKQQDVFLPFEGDVRLSEILSKAFLLAADTKIRDATIIRQLNA